MRFSLIAMLASAYARASIPWFAYLALSHLGEVKQKDGGSSGFYRVLLRSPGGLVPFFAAFSASINAYACK
jgi:hypothetical protein